MFKIILRNKKQYIQTKYLDGIEIEDVEINDQEYDEDNLTKDQQDFYYVYNSFPEQYYQAADRAKSIQNTLYWNSRKNQFNFSDDGKVAILMFSHGAIVNSYTEVLDYGRKLP